MNTKNTVVKRSGEIQEYDQTKIEKLLNWATDGLDGVDISTILAHFSVVYVNNQTSTVSIHNNLVKAAMDLVSEDTPNYEFVAGKLYNLALRKEVWGGINAPRLIDLIKNNTKRGFYSKDILEKYSRREINKINEFINHDLDFDLPYSAINQISSKYLFQDRQTKDKFETPQFVYALVAMTLFMDEDPKVRLDWVKRAYHQYSNKIINLATPIFSKARTKSKSFASCALIEMDDTSESIMATSSLAHFATVNSYGLGINVSNVRPKNAKIRSGETLHTGLQPYLRQVESVVAACHQNGIRGGAGTIFINWWHYEIEDVLQLKDNLLTDELAVRKLDYALVTSRLLRERFKNKEDITLFNPHEVPELLETFGDYKAFKKAYEIAEKKEGLMKKVVNARKVFGTFIKQRSSTNRIYVYDIDNGNEQSPFKEKIKQSNLCLEVTQPTKPCSKLNDPNGLIGVCILSAINPLPLKTEADWEESLEVAVRMLDNLISYQDYFDTAAERFAKNYRSLGIGIFNYAAYLASKGIKYNTQEAVLESAKVAEKLSYFAVKASIKLAKERGSFEWFDKTKWYDGELPIDRYNKNVDAILGGNNLQYNWEDLRALLKKHGLRNSTLIAYMPVESSSIATGCTSGIEPIKNAIVGKSSRVNSVTQVAPNYAKWKDSYVKAYDIKDNTIISNIYLAFNKFTCMSLSMNHFVSTSEFSGAIPASAMAKDALYFIENGGITMYYLNTNDNAANEEDFGCSSGGCKL